MSRNIFTCVPAILLLGAGLTWVGPRVLGQTTPLPSTARGEWPMYTADLRGSKYSPLDQINAGNFNKLEVAWRLKTDNFGTRPEYKLEATPIMVNGVLYMTAGTRRSVIAVDAKSGEIMWTHSYREGTRAAIAPRQLSGRGVSYWSDGKGDDRIIYVTTGYRMIALNAKNGQMIAAFGTNGVVDLKDGAMFGNRQPIDKETGEIGLHSTPTITKDTIIVGSSFKEGMTVLTHNNTKGMARAFDVRTGKLIWTFNVGERLVVGQWQHRCVDADQRRRRGRTRLPAGGNAHLRLLRRPSPRQQPVCREHRGRRREDRRAQVALPDDSSRHLGP